MPEHGKGLKVLAAELGPLQRPKRQPGHLLVLVRDELANKWRGLGPHLDAVAVEEVNCGVHWLSIQPWAVRYSFFAGSEESVTMLCVGDVPPSLGASTYDHSVASDLP
jgi:hypothetical protein